MSKTNVFISSTCYDLSQIRKDLKEGIEAMGHTPILSENRDFPVNPSLPSAENCMEAVRNEADIFVLIIGNRYGYKLDSGKSITNTEFLTAYRKGIPIYTFTLKNIIYVFPVWKKNPQGDFCNIVDDNRVFEFVDDVRGKKGIWNFEFESAQDILEILKAQWSFLFRQALISHKRIQDVDNVLASKLSNRALKILLEKSDDFEILIFLQMMQDEIDKYGYLKKDCDHSIILKPGPYISEPLRFTNWIQEKIQQVITIIDSLNRLFQAFNLYIREPGTPADIDGLCYLAQRYGELYASLLDWVIDVRSTNTDDTYRELVYILSEYPLEAIGQIESYPKKSLCDVEDALQKVVNGEIKKGSTINLSLRVSIDESVQDRLSREIDHLTNQFMEL